MVPNLCPTLCLYYLMDASLYDAAGYQKFAHENIFALLGICLANLSVIGFLTYLMNRLLIQRDFNCFRKKREYKSENDVSFGESKTMIKVSRLTKKFNHGGGIDDISLEIKRNEVFGLLGNNGCGKTTFINILTGIL